ncbi:MAG: hypothetical protein AAFP76_11560 [Bacteroidota bacterium]
MKKKTVLLIVMLGLVAGAYIGYRYLYKDHRNIETEASVLTIKADRLQERFQNGTEDSLLNRTLTIKGTITQVEEQSVLVDEKVLCSFNTLPTGLIVGDEVEIKGRCIGYDDLFEIVKMDQSTLTKL